MNTSHQISSGMLPETCCCLTNREKEILSMIFDEKTNREIAMKLCISIRTVDRHRENLLTKLGAKNTVGLVKAVYTLKSSGCSF